VFEAERIILTSGKNTGGEQTVGMKARAMAETTSHDGSAGKWFQCHVLEGKASFDDTEILSRRRVALHMAALTGSCKLNSPSSSEHKPP